jgi:aspartyl-tRNA(Asn)/glutamyl-tRNA(Gln) amidotransferase subunit A
VSADLDEASLTEQVAALRQRRVSAPELLEACLRRIESGRSLRAFITVTAERARRQAKLAQRRLDQGDQAPLLGVPVAVKDLFATAGVRTTAGSRILRDWVPRRDAAAVARLRQAGAVLVGKTNLHEFAYGVTTSNPHWGVARNPWDPSRTPGGSSGGSAIAVVTGMCAGALGSDTGGSIRIPAALTGCVGLKPTYGAVPLGGCVPLAWSLDHAGPITRRVEDAGLLFEVLAGRPAPSRQRRDGLRIGILRGELVEDVDPDVRSAVDAALFALRKDSVQVREIRLPELALSVAAQLVTLRSEASAVHHRWLRSRKRSYGRDVLLRLQLGALIPAIDYVFAQRARDRLLTALARCFERVDVIALPTTPILAPRIGERVHRWKTGSEPIEGALVRLTLPFNLTGAPAISVPCAIARGLPVGLQLAGAWGDEGSVLELARLVEARADLSLSK